MKAGKSAVLITLGLVLAGWGFAGDSEGTGRQSASIAQGQGSYTENCAACHGVGGAGDGVVAAVLKPEVPDLTQLCIGNHGRFPADRIYRVIDGRTEFAAHGSRLMPIWGMEFWLDEGADERADVRVAEKIHQLVDYVESLAKDCSS